ncbi:MAG: cob(I)yrinic acid a,c-diamide adenosyltransferase [Promethearchaeia archaeon]
MTNHPHLEYGLVHYYYGEGRGKTSTSMGTIIRALGHGFKPVLIQFLKLHDEEKKHQGYFIGEVHFLKDLIPIKQFGSYEFIYPDEKPPQKVVRKAQRGVEYAKSVISSGDYDLVVLDEIGEAIRFDLVNTKEIIKIVQAKPDHVEVILTGTTYNKNLCDIADYVTHFELVRHPYYDGFKARPGIEF